MTGPNPIHSDLTVSANEHGVVRVFALDMPREQALFQREPGAAAASLGVAALDPAQVEVIQLADLDDIGLSGYLIEGCGVPRAEVAPDADRLDALEGFVMVVHSRAFREKPTTLAPTDGVRPVAAYGVTPTDWSGSPIASTSAQPHSAPRVAPRAARAEARRIGAMAFGLFLAIVAVIALLVVIL